MLKRYTSTVVFALISVFFIAFGQSQNKFQRFHLNDKLPSNSVGRILSDSEGYMWFGTKDGLCRYDGYDIKVFRSSALTPGKLSNNEIQCIAEDKKQQLWVGTLEGIVIVDKKNYAITKFTHPLTDRERINSILVDQKGCVWIGTSNFGVLKHNPETGKTEQFSDDKNAKFRLSGKNVNYIYEDKSGRIWISMWKDGLCFFNKDNSKLVHVDKIGFSNNPFRVFEDREGDFWICTWGDGVFKLKFNNNIPQVLPLQVAAKSKGKLNEIVYGITQDNVDGRLWLVTFSGLTVLNKEPDGTVTLNSGGGMLDEISTQLFHEIYKDRRGNLWLGTVGDGLYKLEFNRLPIQNFSLSEIKKALNIPSYVTRFCETPDKNVFISINRIGVFSFNPATGAVKRPENQIARRLNSIYAITYIKHLNQIWIANEGDDIVYVFKNNNTELEFIQSFTLNNSKVSQENTISEIYEDSKSNIWIGTVDGLYLKMPGQPVKQLYTMFRNIISITEDVKGNLWVGTGKEGVFRTQLKNKADGSDYVFTNIALKINDYTSYGIQSISTTKNAEVYIGTREGCLFLYDYKNNSAKDISALYGITEEGIMDIVTDDLGVLWISTIKRIIRYNPQTHAATYYSNADGLLVNSFFKNSFIKLRSGAILFGGNNGISVFDPKNQPATNKSEQARVVITDILIQNKSIFANELNLNYNAGKNEIRLKNAENNLSIEFSALDYVAANKIQYAYKLSGVDKDWNYVGNNRRFVNYANLPSGSYTFMVKANDENGYWNDQVTTLKVKILPPLYLSWWAYLLYFAVIALIVNITYRNLSNRIRLSNELKISKIEKDKSEELAQIKLRYFTNISHELLTPLTIIMLQIESIQQKVKGELFQMDIMRDNVVRLKRLIQQILVFRKTESGNMKLKIQKDDIVAFVNNICQSNFRPLVNEKKVNFSINIEKESFWAYFDPDKLDKAIYNVLSNAFKYTPANGDISVKMSFVDRAGITYTRLSVSDSGKGIAEEDLPNIFKRFYISKSADQSQSHGIGLALTSDLLQLHKGSIEVQSQYGEGSVFTIEIPVSANVYTEEELSDERAPEEITMFDDLSEIVLDANESSIENLDEETKDFTILVVEDNKELNNLILQSFSEKFHVLSAENGIQALELLKANEVDLIISDVMMPGMDGLTLCKLIKNEVDTSHINVLMLTAKNTAEDRIDCYNAGADAYIAKPFEMSVLKARVKNLISRRIKKTEDFKSNQEINITSMEYRSIDELFLKQAVQKVEDKIADDTFDFDQFALDMATSKSTLHRKLKSLTGLSPGEFIRSVRLKHAVQMLNKNVGNISEIAFAVGFNDPKYFSRCFKIEFGMTPKEFQETNRSKKEE